MADVRALGDRLHESSSDVRAASRAIRADVDTLKAGVDSLKADVDTLKAGVDSLKADVDSLKAGVQAGLAKYEADVEGLKAAVEVRKQYSTVRPAMSAVRRRVLGQHPAAWEAFRSAHGVEETDFREFLGMLEDLEADVAFEWRPHWGALTASYSELKAIAPLLSPRVRGCFEYVLDIGRSCGVYN